MYKLTMTILRHLECDSVSLSNEKEVSLYRLSETARKLVFV